MKWNARGHHGKWWNECALPLPEKLTLNWDVIMAVDTPRVPPPVWLGENDAPKFVRDVIGEYRAMMEDAVAGHTWGGLDSGGLEDGRNQNNYPRSHSAQTHQGVQHAGT